MPPRNRKAHKDSGQSVRGQNKVSTNSTRHVQKQQSNPTKEKTEKKVVHNQVKSRSAPYVLAPLKAFFFILFTRLCSAIMSNISDCDETFNYWEPVHYLLYGKGFQTWEYSPTYAIRSYAYLWFYTLPAMVFSRLLQENKYLVFYLIRSFLALFCSLCEVYFYKGVIKQFGPGVARYVFLFLIFPTGFFISSTAMLPNTFSMYMVLIMLGAWFHHHNRFAILAMGFSTLLGWPFSAIVCLPVLWDLLIVRKNRFHLIKWAIIFGIFIVGILISIDSYYYGKVVLAPLNIILYNVFTKHGANLYGTEPWYFYLLNCLLNFNILLAPCFMALPIMGLTKLSKSKVKRNLVTNFHWVSMASLIFFIVTLSLQAHKEERFLFPAYPFICLAASFSFDIIQKFITSNFPKLHILFSSASLGFLTCFALISSSRTIALIRGFHAPIETFSQLKGIDMANKPFLPEKVNVCVGKEWYRFPSSFFLPDSDRWKLMFIQSEFRGQLPQPYQEGPLSTRIVPKNMNDKNSEEVSRYIQVKNCHLLIDSDRPVATDREPRYSTMARWTKIFSSKMLDVESSLQFWRSFWIPHFFYSKNKFIDYVILKNEDLNFIRK